jgi:outer membrane protein assembly factor BamD (BamD/ComL family)
MKSCFTFAVLTLFAATSAFAADVDTVYRKNESRGFGGQITAANKTEVVVTQRVGNRSESFPANEIDRVEFTNEPAVLGLARGNVATGQWQEALKNLQDAQATNSNNQNLKGEIDYLACYALVQIAQRDPSRIQEALDKINAFLNTYRDHYRVYPVQKLQGETALLAENADVAETAFLRLKEAPWAEYQMAAKAGIGRTLLLQKKVNEAKTIFDEVASSAASSPAEKSSQLQGMLGQAECLIQLNQVEEATKVLQKVVDEAAASDTRLLAQTYLQLGDAYSLDGQRAKDAVLAYLHVDVIPSLASHADLHAEALFRLSKLWPAIGQPARGADAAARLEQDYPDSTWTKQLSTTE